MLLNFDIKIRILPSHLHHEVFTGNNHVFVLLWYEHTCICVNVAYPLSANDSALGLLEKYNVPTMRIHLIIRYEVSPWLMKPQCRLVLANAKKCIPTQIRSVAVDYTDHIILCIDGPKTPNVVGNLFVDASALLIALIAYNTELYVVWQALRYCERQCLRRCALLSVGTLMSLSPLWITQARKQVTTKNGNTAPCLRTSGSVIFYMGAKIDIIWVGIKGDENDYCRTNHCGLSRARCRLYETCWFDVCCHNNNTLQPQ